MTKLLLLLKELSVVALRTKVLSHFEFKCYHFLNQSVTLFFALCATSSLAPCVWHLGDVACAAFRLPCVTTCHYQLCHTLHLRSCLFRIIVFFLPGTVRRYFHSDMFIQGSCLGVCPSIRMTSIIHALAATKQTLSPRYNEKWIPTLSLFSQALPIYYQDCKALPIYYQDSVKCGFHRPSNMKRFSQDQWLIAIGNNENACGFWILSIGL